LTLLDWTRRDRAGPMWLVRSGAATRGGLHRTRRTRDERGRNGARRLPIWGAGSRPGFGSRLGPPVQLRGFWAARTHDSSRRTHQPDTPGPSPPGQRRRHVSYASAQVNGLIVAYPVGKPGWQTRPHDSLRDPDFPRRALSRNEAYASMVAAAGYLPVTLTGDDYRELLPRPGGRSTTTASASTTAPTTRKDSNPIAANRPASQRKRACGRCNGLDRQPIDPERAQQVLAYPLHAAHVAIIAWSDSPLGITGHDLRSVWQARHLASSGLHQGVVLRVTVCETTLGDDRVTISELDWRRCSRR
jgi:hypothetical protein